MADGRLPRDLERAAQGHLEDCAECAALIATIVFSQVDDAAAATAPAARLQDMPVVPAGTRIGRFTVEQRLGAGGMGAVYRAHDPELARRVAIKLLHPGRGGAHERERFLREAQAAAQLNHPNVVAVYDVGRHDGEIYIAMELVEGQDLRAWLKAAKHPWPAILAAFVAAGRGLAAAHAAGLIHRDFKPDNALMGADGRVRVVDFGLARGIADATLGIADAAPAPTLAEGSPGQPSAVVGTPMYMSPEQRAGDALDPRSDQFSFCVALYHALYRNHPFSEGTHVALPPPTESPVAKAVYPIVARGLAEDPDARWPSMNALLDALEAVDAPSRLRPFAFLGGATVVAVLIVAIAIVGFGNDESAAAVPPMDHAETTRLRAEVQQLERDKQHADAQRGFVLGQTFFEDGRYFRAAAEFAEAYRAWQHPAFAFNVASAYAKAQHCPNALAWFRHYEASAPDATDLVDVRARIELLARDCPNDVASHAPGTLVQDAPFPDEPTTIAALAVARDQAATDPCAALDAARAAPPPGRAYRYLDWIGTLERACAGRMPGDVLDAGSARD